MRVCMVSKHFYPYLGGLEARVLDLGKWIAATEHEVLVLTSHERKTKTHELVDGIMVHRSHVLFNLFNGLFCPGVLRDLFRLDYDVIDVNLPDPVNGIFAYLAAKFRNKPLVVTYHADILKDRFYHKPFLLFYNFFQNRLLKKAKVIFATSPNYAESSPVLKKYMKKVQIASSFVDELRYNPKVDGSAVKARFAPGDKKLILFVGRLIHYKGVEVLLDAFSKLKDEIDASLVIVGEGVLEKDLKKKATKLAIINDTYFTGKVPFHDLPKYYAACDLFVLPSVNRAEAFGLVLAEAMATKKPVITSNFSGMPYVMRDSGLTIEKGNASQLYSAILKILLDEDLSREFGENGRARVEKLFTADVVAKKILEVYKSIL